MEDDEVFFDEDYLDEIEFRAYESPRSHVEIFRTDLIKLLELAREALEARAKAEEH